MKTLILAFSLASYALFLLVFLYLLAFLIDLPATPLADAFPELTRWVPYTIDTGRTPMDLPWALAVNLILVSLFGLQHSVMARQGFKRVWTRVVPEAAERSMYVLLSSIVLVGVMWFWQPISTPVLWDATGTVGAYAGWSVLAIGVIILLWSTFLIDHFDLFGLRQAWAALRERPAESPRFMTPMLYRIVRHPLYVGWFLIFWGTPTLSLGHALFAAGMTGYIFIAIRFEEQDLVSFHGDAYERYRQEVPMMVPLPGRSGQVLSEGISGRS